MLLTKNVIGDNRVSLPAAIVRSIWLKQKAGSSVGLIQEQDAYHLNCYTNLERSRGVYKPTLIVFYYANRKGLLFMSLVIS